MAEQKTIVGQTTAEVVDVVTNSADKLVDRIAEVISAYGPQVSDATLSMLRIDAIVSFVPSIFILIIGIVFIYFTAKINAFTRHGVEVCRYRRATTTQETVEKYGKDWAAEAISDETALVFYQIVLGFLGLLSIVLFVYKALAPAIGMFVPEYWALVKAGIL